MHGYEVGTLFGYARFMPMMHIPHQDQLAQFVLYAQDMPPMTVYKTDEYDTSEPRLSISVLHGD